MKQRLSSEFIYQLFALLITIIIVHGVYVGLVRPNADAILQVQAELQAAGEDFVPDRSIFVVIRDLEQVVDHLRLVMRHFVMAAWLVV